MAKNLDYEKIGFKSGLEIHQQLDTGKLFCNCPSVLRQDEPDYVFRRKLHAIAGESGEIDVAAKHEASQDKEFIYQAYDTTCLVEEDEEPPHEINSEALKIALQISILLNCKIIPITQIMRKTVIDGSNTSGFQRTMMIARDGYVETSFGRVGIEAVFLEEDSARPVGREDNEVIYRLDRLGIPLVEIATAPDIKTPEQIKEAALHIGDVLRSCKVRRGLGTIRQDINLSIKGSHRVEIKGFQNISMMVETSINEIHRHIKLNEISKTIPKLDALKIEDFGSLVKPTASWIKDSVKKGSTILGFKLNNFKGILGKELIPGYRVGTELSKFAKSRGFGGIIHFDEDLTQKYGFSKNDIEKMKSELGVRDNDSFILVIGEEKKVRVLINEVLFPRILKLKDGVLPEVRNALPNATTEFLRPMSGQARMYPETDLPLLKISRDLINGVKKSLPKRRSEVEEDLKKSGLSLEMIKILFKQNKIEEYKELLEILNRPQLVAKILLVFPKDIASREKMSVQEIDKKLTKDVLVHILENIKKNKISESDVKHILQGIVRGKFVEEVIAIEKEDASIIEEKVLKIIKSKPGLNPNAYMGLVMKEFKGKITGKEAMEIIRKFIE